MDGGNVNRLSKRLQDQTGAVAVMVGLLLVVLVGFTALAVDIGHLLMVRNELQNAADAGALAGARNLYWTDPDTDTVSVNPGANLVAWETATANRAMAKYADASGSNYLPVDIDFSPEDNSGDIQRGHWSFFPTPQFVANGSLAAFDQETLWNSTFEELDADTDLINAVRVTTRRQANPASSFFARIFGFNDFLLSATAVAYLGYVNTINPGEIDIPLAICKETITNNNGDLQCNLSRVINSGNQEDSNTGGWTNFSQDTEYWPEGCRNPTSAEINGTGQYQDQGSMICGNGNPRPVVIGESMAVFGGAMPTAFGLFLDCWDEYQANNLADGEIGRFMPKKGVMAVVECGSNNTNGPCPGLPTHPPVSVEIIWVTPRNWPEPQRWQYAPSQMEDWSYPADPGNTNGQARWESFVDHFQLKNKDGDPAHEDYYPMTIYAKPNCEQVEPMGTGGGSTTGPLALYPKLVN
jgi:hypothetical protein